MERWEDPHTNLAAVLIEDRNPLDVHAPPNLPHDHRAPHIGGAGIELQFMLVHACMFLEHTAMSPPQKPLTIDTVSLAKPIVQNDADMVLFFAETKA